MRSRYAIVAAIVSAAACLWGAPPEQAVRIEVKFTERAPGGETSTQELPAMVVRLGEQAEGKIGEDRELPAGRIAEHGAEPPEPVPTGLRLSVTPRPFDEGILLTGRATFVEVTDEVPFHGPNRAASVSYTTQTIVLPVSLILFPDDKFAALPMAKAKEGDKQRELLFRIALVPAPPPRVETQISIEARFIQHLPGGTQDVLSAPKVTVLENRVARIQMVGELQIPNGSLPEEVAGTKTPEADRVETGTVLEVTARVQDDGILVTGQGTITDFLCMLEMPPPSEPNAYSYVMRTQATPFAVVVKPDGPYVSLPMAKGDPKSARTELQIRAKLVGVGAPEPRKPAGPRKIIWQ